jgi:hypothetical protein
MYTIQLLAEEGPNTELSSLLLIVLGVFVLIVVVGWLTSSRKSE